MMLNGYIYKLLLHFKVSTLVSYLFIINKHIMK